MSKNKKQGNCDRDRDVFSVSDDDIGDAISTQ